MESLSNIEEKELIIRLKNGDKDAFTRIYEQYWKHLFGVAAHKIKDLSEAEEVVQDIFTDLWNRRETLELTSSLSAYLFVCVKYQVIKILAKRNHQLRYRNYFKGQDIQSDLSTEHWLRFEELRHQLANETEKLPQKCRLVFQLSREHGYSQAQIARELGISEKTVESHLTKALKNLRSSLGQFFSFFF